MSDWKVGEEAECRVKTIWVMNRDKIQILVMGTGMRLAVLVVMAVMSTALYDKDKRRTLERKAKESKK